MSNDKAPIIPSKDELNKKLEEISKEKTEFRMRDMMANCYCPAPPPRPPHKEETRYPSSTEEYPPKKQKKSFVSKILSYFKK